MKMKPDVAVLDETVEAADEDMLLLAKTLKPRHFYRSVRIDRWNGEKVKFTCRYGRYCASWFCSQESQVVHMVESSEESTFGEMSGCSLSSRLSSLYYRVLSSRRTDKMCYSCGTIRDVVGRRIEETTLKDFKQVLKAKDVLSLADDVQDSE